MVSARTPNSGRAAEILRRLGLWHRGRVTALLDLEMAYAEAPDWELGPFLTACLDPPKMTPAWLGEAYPELFAYPDLRERLALYALVLRSGELTDDPARCAEVIETARAWVRAFEPILPQ